MQSSNISQTVQLSLNQRRRNLSQANSDTLMSNCTPVQVKKHFACLKMMQISS